MIIVDAHEDLAWNILTYGRDYTRPVAETRRLEAGTTGAGGKEDTLLGWPEYQRGQVAVVFGTLFAAPARGKQERRESQSYRDYQEAHQLYQGQVDTYHRMVDQHPDQFHLIESDRDLCEVLNDWQEESPAQQPPGTRRVGIVILMEGAEGVREPAELEEWWEKGVRIIGPAWAGTRYCGGTNEPGPMTAEGFVLLEAMESFGFSLDVSHMDEAAVLQALDRYAGAIIASHGNAKKLLKGADSNRHLTDRVIRGLVERNGVIGIVPYNRFLDANWRTGDRRELVSLQRVVDQIDAICQIAGDARHVGIGSDFDGGFGLQSVPAEIDSVADLQKLIPLLTERGYNRYDVAAILGQNWLRFLHRTLPGRTSERLMREYE